MPLPAIPVAAGLGAAAIGLISRILVGYAVVKAGVFVLKVLTFFGIAFATNEYLVEPLMDLVSGRWGAMPGNISQWMGILNLDKCVSVIASAYTIAAAQRVFLAKAS